MPKETRRLAWITVLLVLLLAVNSCGPKATEAPAAEATEAPATESPGVFYGEDNRLEPYDTGVSDLQREMAANVALLVRPSAVTLNNGRATLTAPTLDQKYGPFCPGQQFIDQAVPGFCTGFLVAPNVLVTAGHCVKDADACENTRFVFGYQMRRYGRPALVPASSVYECETLVTSVREPEGADYAIVILDRATDLPGLVYAVDDPVEEGEAVLVIGHPSGLPVKVTNDVMVLETDDNRSCFVLNSDTFGGNSGSPVIEYDDPARVVGLLVRGEADYVTDPLSSPACVRVKTCAWDASDCKGEEAVKMSALHTDILKALEMAIP
ncbi:MAG: trypsin-like peptidase domain-containing protein [Anaerolineales bacterium]|nr:trypsin-like peptidase domain-containing protein [Anaerolineales bacterium]